MKNYIITFKRGGESYTFHAMGRTEMDAFYTVICKEAAQYMMINREFMTQIEDGSLRIVRKGAAAIADNPENSFINWLADKSVKWITAPKGTATNNIGQSIINKIKSTPNLGAEDMYYGYRSGREVELINEGGGRTCVYVINYRLRKGYQLNNDGTIIENTRINYDSLFSAFTQQGSSYAAFDGNPYNFGPQPKPANYVNP